mgnify:CR=1 FL=1
MTTKEDVEQKLAEVLFAIEAHTDAINKLTQEQYEQPNYNCRVIKGQLQFDTTNLIRVQLKKSTSGVAVVRGHANLVIEEEYSDIEYYDRIS